MVNTARDCALYLRISQDREGDGLAHERQREDCERIIHERGWNLVGVYADSVSAYDRHKRRPEYERMVDDYAAGKFDAIACWDLDRLTRQPRQLEDWIEAAEERGLALVTANGEADLGTDGGRLYARLKAAVARGEMERKGARQRRAIAQRVERGLVPSGVRLTGYAQDGTINPDEAELIRDMFTRFNAGESLHAIATRLNADGIMTRRGGAWRPSSIRTILLNPRYCGRQVFKGEATGHLGDWEPIVSEAVFDTTSAILTDPRRVTNRQGTERKHLGSSLYYCGVCGDRLTSHSSPRRYRCRDHGHLTRSAEPIDAYVRGIVAAWLTSAAVGSLDLNTTDDKPENDTLAVLRQRLAQVEADYDEDLIDARRYKVKRDKILAEMKAAEREHRRARSGPAVADILGAEDPAEAFENAPLGVQRTIIEEFMEVRLLPAPRGRRTFDPATVQITWLGA